MTPGSAPRERPKSAPERPWRPPPGALQRDDFPPRDDFRTISILRKTFAKRSLLPGRLFGRQATAEQADALETLAAQARVATVPTRIPDGSWEAPSAQGAAATEQDRHYKESIYVATRPDILLLENQKFHNYVSMLQNLDVRQVPNVANFYKLV